MGGLKILKVEGWTLPRLEHLDVRPDALSTLGLLATEKRWSLLPSSWVSISKQNEPVIEKLYCKKPLEVHEWTQVTIHVTWKDHRQPRHAATSTCRLGRLPSAPWPNQTDFVSYSLDQAVHRSGSVGNFGGENVSVDKFQDGGFLDGGNSNMFFYYSSPRELGKMNPFWLNFFKWVGTTT